MAFASVNKCLNIPNLQALQYASITDCFISYGHLNDVSVNINKSWRKRSLSDTFDNSSPRLSSFFIVKNLCFIRFTFFHTTSLHLLLNALAVLFSMSLSISCLAANSLAPLSISNKLCLSNNIKTLTVSRISTFSFFPHVTTSCIYS